MSKSAIAALTKAQEIIAAAGVNVNLAGYVTDSNVRKNWRNADALAALIINSVGNAFQTENTETFADNCFADMGEAVTRYIDANLDDWNQKTAAFMNLISKIELDLLAGMVAANMAFETRTALVNKSAEEAHAEALEVNAVIDEATRRAACFSDLDSATPNAINHAINYVRNSLLGLNRYNARFIVKMMIATRNLAKEARIKAAEKHREMLARCATATNEQISNEIPF